MCGNLSSPRSSFWPSPGRGRRAVAVPVGVTLDACDTQPACSAPDRTRAHQPISTVAFANQIPCGRAHRIIP